MRIAVFTLALLLRIAAIEWHGGDAVLFGDGPDYLAAAGALCDRGLYPERGNLPFFRAPGLPFFIAGVTACDPGRVRLVKYALAVCDAISALLMASLAALLWRSPRAGSVAGLLAALHPFFWGAVTDIRTEPLFMMLLLAAIHLLYVGRNLPAGMAVGLAALTRPTALLCIPLFAIYLAVRRGRLAPAALFVFASVLTLAPWAIRNYVRFGEVILVNDAAGFNLWRGMHPETLRVVGLQDRTEYGRSIYHFETVTVAEMTRRVERLAATPASRDRAWRRLALEQVRRDPGAAVRASLVKVILFWRPWLHPIEHDLPAVLVSFLVTIALYAAGAAGLATLHDRGTVFAAVAFIVVIWAAHAPYVPTIRLRSPVVDPLMIAFAAGPLTAAVLRRRADGDADSPHRSAATSHR